MWVSTDPASSTVNAWSRRSARQVWKDSIAISASARVRSARTGSGSSRSTSRSEEHTSELQSLMSISYAVFCLKKKKEHDKNDKKHQNTNKKNKKASIIHYRIIREPT